MEEPQVEIIEKDDGELHAQTVTPQTSVEDETTLSVKGYLNITGKSSGKMKKELQDVINYARKDADTDDTTAILMVLRNLENRLRAPRVDESRLSQLYEYVRVQNAISSAESERDSMTR